MYSYTYTHTDTHTCAHRLNNKSMLEYQLQHKDFWMKKPYSPNERTNFMNKDSAVWKLFMPLTRSFY